MAGSTRQNFASIKDISLIKKWFRFPQCFLLVCVLLNQKLREQDCADCEEGEDGNNFHVADVVLIENEDNQTDCYESCII